MRGLIVGTAARRQATLAAVAGCLLAAASSHANADTATVEGNGTSSRAAYREAVDAIPLERLAKPQADAVRRCLRSTTLYRRLPSQTIPCDRGLLEFSLEHPEAIVDLWRVLDISRLTLDPSGRGQWRLADGYGTVGMLRLLHHDGSPAGGTMLLIGRGVYSGALSPKPLSGNCLVLLRHAPATPAADGRERHTIVIDAFLDMDGIGLEIVTRTLQPLIVKTAGWNVREICTFISELSNACEENPEGVARLTSRLSRTEPADRERLAAIARAAGGPRRAAAVVEDDPDRLSLELASRWLPADEMPEVR